MGPVIVISIIAFCFFIVVMGFLKYMKIKNIKKEVQAMLDSLDLKLNRIERKEKLAEQEKQFKDRSFVLRQVLSKQKDHIEQ